VETQVGEVNISLPQFTTTNKLSDNTSTTISSVVRSYNSLITNLTQIFTSLLQKVQLDSVILQSIPLNAGSVTIIPHTLGRTLSGWQIVRLRGLAVIYDSQDQNPNPQTYLQLVSTDPVVVDILVF
jgi:hypothetical protein